MKFIFTLLLLLFTLSSVQIYSQETSHRREKKHARKKSGKGGGPSNAFIDRKDKNKPSNKLSRQNRRDQRKINKASRKQMNHSRKKLGYKKLRKSERR